MVILQRQNKMKAYKKDAVSINILLHDEILRSIMKQDVPEVQSQKDLGADVHL